MGTSVNGHLQGKVKVRRTHRIPAGAAVVWVGSEVNASSVATCQAEGTLSNTAQLWSPNM